MAANITCLVTIHGIGFQQVPEDGVPGYADPLHQHLSKMLSHDILGDDPNRKRDRPGECGPIYVQSSWPPDENILEAGLARLGKWNPDGRTVDGSKAPLVDGDQRIAHVALVYSRLQDQAPHTGAAIETIAKTALSMGHYTTVAGMARMAFTDLQAIFEPPIAAAEPESPSLRVRAEPNQAPGVLDTIKQLEDDVAAYVCRDDLRERVRTFVIEALLRLCAREDVARVIINTHSNGTVIGFDSLRRLHPAAASKVNSFITSGSALRKYATLFYWTTEVGWLAGLGDGGWANFWDPRDPVADPLSPPATWQRGEPLPGDRAQRGLYFALDDNTGQMLAVDITDTKVDNVAHSVGGGLRAHNYWDNTSEVVMPIANILRKVATV